VKKLFRFLATSIVLLGTFSNPIELKADGNPPPMCPSGKSCKPLAVQSAGLR
jgi:hypothetical protein